MNTILIYWLIASSANFSSTGTVQFGDGASCLAARTAIIKQWQGDAGADAVCVPAGPQTVTEPSVSTPGSVVAPPSTIPAVPIVINVPPPPTPAVVVTAPRHYP